MGFFVEREDSTKLGDEYMVSVNGDVRNYFEDEIAWIDA